MATPNEIALFDLDGVLILPGGYRQATYATIQHFLQQAGLDGKWGPVEAELAAFESLGISAEWDMIPIWMALVLEELSSGLPVDRWINWEAASADLRNYQFVDTRPVWIQRVLGLREYLISGVSPSAALLRHQNGKAAFSRLRGSAVLSDLLANTRSIDSCRTTQVFQAHVLGSKEYDRLWTGPAPVTCSSSLQTYDQPLLSPELAEELNRRAEGGQVGYAAFTARPSRAPVTVSTVRTGYTPEAEMAVSLIPLNNLPVVGHGAVQWMAEQAGVLTEQLLKPAPFQALIGIAAAFGHAPANVLQWGYHIASGQVSAGVEELDLPARFTVHVFEDSPNGIRSAAAAQTLLQNAGYSVRLNAWGIAENPDKKAALEALGAAVFANINHAVPAAWPDWFRE